MKCIKEIPFEEWLKNNGKILKELPLKEQAYRYATHKLGKGCECKECRNYWVDDEAFAIPCFNHAYRNYLRRNKE